MENITGGMKVSESMQIAVVVILIFIAIQVFECTRFLQKILKLLYVQAGQEKVLESFRYGKND